MIYLLASKHRYECETLGDVARILNTYHLHVAVSHTRCVVDVLGNDIYVKVMKDKEKERG